MSIESIRNRINKRVELKKYKRDFTDIGSFIKEKRKALNVTQDDISTGICSISYLSKIENNQIVPNDFYVKEIMEKLDVDKAIYANSLKEKQYLEKVITSYFYMENDRMEEVFHDIIQIEHNLNLNLCKLGYTVYFKLNDENQYVMMLENLLNNMTDYEVKIYLYFASVYFIQNEKYKTALELIVLSQKLDSNNEYLNGMFYEISYYVKQRLLIKNSSNEDYYNAITIFTKYHNVDRIVSLVLNKAKNLAIENPKKALMILKTIKVSLLNKETRDLYYFIKAEILTKLKRSSDATLSLKNIADESSFFLRKMVLLLKICLEEDDIEMIQSIHRIVQNYKPSKIEMKSKVHYHYLTQKTEEDRKEYLRDIAIPFSISVEDYEKLGEYTDSVMEICVENSRYKEAIQYYKKYQKEMSKVRRIMY